MTRRSRGREVALQVLYQVEQNPGMGILMRSAVSFNGALLEDRQALRVYRSADRRRPGASRAD